jgi:serine/threonine protein phosphatase PrpC
VSAFDDIEYASLTDVGVRRSHNQDAHVLMPATEPEQWQQRGHVFLVADGMGAHAVGELASKMAVDNIPHIYSKHAEEGATASLRKAFIEANCTIHTRGQQNREFHGMGTTASALVLRADGAWMGHVGDSRVYRIRRGVIEQLTFDHSLVWELARRQGKAPEEMHGIPPNVIVRSLGPEPLVQVDVEGPHPIEPGDAYLLCSDGLTGQVTDREIGAVISVLPPEEACRFLVHLANLQGGPDNTTVIIVRVGSAAPDGAGSTVAAKPGPAAPAQVKALMNRLAPLLGRVPWAFLLLGMGVLLAVLAVALTYVQAPYGVPVFIGAGLALFGGLVGLMVTNFRETRPRAAAPQARPVVVYRHTACAIDSALLQKLAGATKSLEANIHEKGWALDTGSYRAHGETAQLATQQGHLREAFAEQCRALMALMDVVHRHRTREESFKPIWDKPAV